MSDRSATIALLLSGLAAQSAPVTANDLRRFVACTPFPVGPSEAPKEPLAKMHAIWRVLQVRQAQRLAFETIFGWMEAQVLVNGVNLSSMIVDALVSEMKVLEPALVEESWVADKMAAYADVGGNNGSLMEAALSESSVDIFRFIDELQHDIWDGHDSRASKAVMLLILCAAISCELAGDERAVAYVKEGGRARVSLAYWSDYVMGNQSFSLRDFLIKVVENFLISQHFGVAASRYSQGKQRLRLTIEEGGLTSMLNSAYDTWRPAVTADRLDALLSLMADCYLVRVEPSQSGPLYGAV